MHKQEIIKLKRLDTGAVYWDYKPQSPERIKEYIEQLREHYNCSLADIAPLIGMKASAKDAGNLRRFFNTGAHARAMPERAYMLLLLAVSEIL